MNWNEKLGKNINRNYIFVLLQYIDLTRGIWMLYLASKGMSLTQLGLLETIFHLTSFSMEVPTGAIADLFGRKCSRIGGRLLALVSILLMLLSNSFWMFALSFVFSALSYNLESGAGDALIYDSLKEIGQEHEYMKISGRKEFFYQLAGTISFLFGGYLATKDYNLVFAISIVICSVVFLLSWTFTEPTIGKPDKNKEGNLFVNQLKESVIVLRNNKRIGTLIIFAEIISVFCTSMFFYQQNYLKGNGYNEAMIGVVYALSSLLPALMATKVHALEKKIKEQGILLIMPIIIIACIWGVTLSKAGVVFFILMMIAEGIVFVATSDYINKMIPSENRATILSFSSMIFSFFMISVFPLIGLIGDRFSLKTSFLCLGVLGIVFVAINSIVLLSGNSDLMAKPRVQKHEVCDEN